MVRLGPPWFTQNRPVVGSLTWVVPVIEDPLRYRGVVRGIPPMPVSYGWIRDFGLWRGRMRMYQESRYLMAF